jgi:hypothetical protein
VAEEILFGGVANAGSVTRDGEYVFRPSNAHSPTIHWFLATLRTVGFDDAPLPIGIDDDQRERLRFIEGNVPLPPYPAWAQSDEALASIIDVMRRFYRASASVESPQSGWSEEMADAAGGSVVCHNDVCLENVVFRDGVAVALLDFDFAAPGRPVYDLAQCARMCVPVDDPVNATRNGWLPADRAARLRLVADTYGLDADGRATLLAVVSESMDRGGAFVQRRVEAGDVNFIKMWNDMGGPARFDRRREWWSDERGRFAAALG